MEMTDEACKHLEFDKKAFAVTVQTIQKSQEQSTKMQRVESEIKTLHLHENTEFNGTKEDALNAFKYRNEQELKMV